MAQDRTAAARAARYRARKKEAGLEPLTIMVPPANADAIKMLAAIFRIDQDHDAAWSDPFSSAMAQPEWRLFRNDAGELLRWLSNGRLAVGSAPQPFRSAPERHAEIIQWVGARRWMISMDGSERCIQAVEEKKRQAIYNGYPNSATSILK